MVGGKPRPRPRRHHLVGAFEMAGKTFAVEEWAQETPGIEVLAKPGQRKGIAG